MADLPATEDALPAARDLDRRPLGEILEVIHAQDRHALEAVGAVLPQVVDAARVLLAVLSGGGRWINVGAGTSGRMGALDAAEIPPTFGLSPDRVRAVVAGGPEALWRAVEGAEDDAEAARRALGQLELGASDAVVALSASGRTPFALAALEAAREVGARRIAVTVDPEAPLAALAEVVIAPRTGPEVIAGSTRMKAGLAQKAVLHLLSTSVMVRMGRVQGNQMTHLRPASHKLRRRAVRIVMELGGVDRDTAVALLGRSGGRVFAALRLARSDAGRSRE